MHASLDIAYVNTTDHPATPLSRCTIYGAIRLHANCHCPCRCVSHAGAHLLVKMVLVSWKDRSMEHVVTRDSCARSGSRHAALFVRKVSNSVNSVDLWLHCL